MNIKKIIMNMSLLLRGKTLVGTCEGYRHPNKPEKDFSGEFSFDKENMSIRMVTDGHGLNHPSITLKQLISILENSEQK